MLTITQGTPNEFQVWVVCGIALFLTSAPIIVFCAGIYGWLTRPQPGADTEASPRKDVLVDSHVLAEPHTSAALHYVEQTGRCRSGACSSGCQSVRPVATGAV